MLLLAALRSPRPRLRGEHRTHRELSTYRAARAVQPHSLDGAFLSYLLVNPEDECAVTNLHRALENLSIVVVLQRNDHQAGVAPLPVSGGIELLGRNPAHALQGIFFLIRDEDLLRRSIVVRRRVHTDRCTVGRWHYTVMRENLLPVGVDVLHMDFQRRTAAVPGKYRAAIAVG